MHKNSLFVGGVVLLILVGVVIFLVNRPGSNTASRKASTDTSNMSMPDKSQTNNNQSTKPTATDSVKISNYAFSPATITVKVGTTVTWTNADAIAHTVTADNPSADAPNSDSITQGSSYSFTFKKAGTYPYHCTPHPYMKGTVIVTE